MSKKNYSKILVIGGSGFVGSRLLMKFDKDSCVNLDKQQSPFFQEITSIKDIRDVENLDTYFEGIDKVVLLAAEHRDDITPKSLYYEVNVRGTKNVLNAMELHNVKNIVFTSSVAVYGLNKDNPNERHEVDPFNHYGKSKWEAEKIIKDWFDKDPRNKSVTIIRPTVIFGEQNRGNVYNLLRQISSGKFLMVGQGDNKKSMAYVGNVVAFIKNRLDASQKGYNVYNYADNPDFTMNDLVQQVERSLSKKIPSFRIPFFIGMIIGYFIDILSLISGKRFAISSVRIKKFCATTQFDSTKAHEVFNAPYSLIQGLDLTLKHEFLKKNKDRIVFYSE